MKQRTPCELCRGEAAVYCAPDAAYLCWDCDAAVHGANFIVARHVRRVVCAACRSLDDDSRRLSGAGPLPSARSVLCRACDPDDPPCPPSPTAASASSESCLSTSESTPADPPRELAAKRRRLLFPSGRAEDILLCWSRRMGLPRWRLCAAAAVDAVAVAACEGVVAALPLRVALAAALWFAVKCREEDASPSGGRGAALRRLEACSGVPARLIAAAESRIARSAGRVRVIEEVWAESS